LSLREIRKIVVKDFSNQRDKLEDEETKKRQRKDCERTTEADALVAARHVRKALKEQLARSMMKQRTTDVQKSSAKLGTIVSHFTMQKNETDAGVLLALSLLFPFTVDVMLLHRPCERLPMDPSGSVQAAFG
jgi:hypothetical protein